MENERRKRRSHHMHEALELQLKATRQRGKFSAVVLTEAQGIPVAAAGDVVAAEEFAVRAPLLANGRRMWQGTLPTECGGSEKVTISPIATSFGCLYMCALGGDAAQGVAEVLIASQGVSRILA
ncbi:MAG: hypothetical protein M0R76_08460 [Proteobacteria bacterium]|nr:hypothetical protein [Pseudomonadota bacterium]NLN63429.1 hypothetical protein [Myxococcales bacterium]